MRKGLIIPAIGILLVMSAVMPAYATTYDLNDTRSQVDWSGAWWQYNIPKCNWDLNTGDSVHWKDYYASQKSFTLDAFCRYSFSTSAIADTDVMTLNLGDGVWDETYAYAYPYDMARQQGYNNRQWTTSIFYDTLR